jgi:hypothetical protein
MESWLESLSPDLFWDVQVSRVDSVKNRRWLVERVLTRGRLEDWLLLSRHISRSDLRDLMPRVKVSPREKHFLLMHVGGDA